MSSKKKGTKTIDDSIIFNELSRKKKKTEKKLHEAKKIQSLNTHVCFGDCEYCEIENDKMKNENKKLLNKGIIPKSIQRTLNREKTKK